MYRLVRHTESPVSTTLPLVLILSAVILGVPLVMGVIESYDSQTEWETGTLTNTTAADGVLRLRNQSSSPSAVISTVLGDTVVDWNTGMFNGTSVDRVDHRGDLGLGYLNGTNPFPTNLENGMVGYWRLDDVIEGSGGTSEIAFDAAASDHRNEANQGSQLSTTHSLGGGDNRLVVTSVYTENDDHDVDTMTYDGTGMTKAADLLVEESNSNRGNLEVWYILDTDLPSAGDYTVEVTYSGGDPDEIGLGVISLENVAQQGPEVVETNEALSTDTISTDITTQTDGSWVVDIVGTGDPEELTPQTGQTLRWHESGDEGLTTTGTAGATEEVATAGTETFTWDQSASGNRMGQVLAAFAPASGSSNITLDYSGNENNGTLKNGVTSGATGVFGTDAFDFAGGVDDWVDVGDDASFSGLSEITASFWVNLDNVSRGQHLIRKNEEIAVTYDNDQIRYDVGTSGSWDYHESGHSLSTDTWYNVALWYNGSEVRLYVNGSLVHSSAESGSAGDSGSITDETSPLAFGWGGGDSVTPDFEMDGQLDEVRIYNRSLSESEIKALYFQGMDGTFEGSYTAEIIEEDAEQAWSEAYVNATVPTETAAWIEVQTQESNGSVVDSEVRSLTTGAQNYTLSVADAVRAAVRLNGTSSAVTDTWEVHELTVYHANASKSTGENYPPAGRYTQTTTELANQTWNMLNVNVLDLPSPTNVDAVITALTGSTSLVHSTATQHDWNAGTFNGTSADRRDNAGILGIGYLNGTNPVPTGLEDGLVGYWRFDNVTKGEGSGVTIVDDFESYADTDDFRSQWSTNDDPMDWGIGDDTSDPGHYEGDQYLEVTDPGGGGDNAVTLPEDDVLNYYPVRGDTIVYYVTPTGAGAGSSSDKNRLFVSFGLTDPFGSERSDYQIGTDVGQDDFEFGKTTDDSYTELENEAVSGGYTENQTYRVEVDWDVNDDGDIVGRLYEADDDTELASFSHTDTDYDSGGIRFQGDFEGDTDAAQHIDYIHVTDGGEPSNVTPDYSGNENNGTLQGDVSSGVSGIFGTDAFDFGTGEDSYVSTPISATQSQFGSGYTFNYWMKLHQINVNMFSGVWSAPRFYLGFRNSTHVQAGVGDSFSSTPYSYSTGEWVMLTTTFDGSTARTYVDGQEADSFSASFSGDNDAIYVGATNDAGSSTRHQTGVMDEVRIYNRSLSESEVAALYFQGMDGTFTGNYGALPIGTDQTHAWETLRVNATSLPSGTTAAAIFASLDANSTVIDTHTIDLGEGATNYTLADVASSANARVSFNFTSTDPEASPEIHGFTVWDGAEPVDEHTFDLKEGNHNYTIDIADTETVDVSFNGTTTDETRTWQIGSYAFYYGADGCSPPQAGNWNVSTNCTLYSPVDAPGNVTVTNQSTLTLTEDAALEIDLQRNYLLVKATSRVLIDALASLY